jgi:hypothetical protein
LNATILDQPVETDVDRRRRLMSTAAQGNGGAEVELGLGLVKRGGKVFLKQGARVTPITPIADTSTATTEQVAVKLNEVAAKLNELIAVLRNAQHLEA